MKELIKKVVKKYENNLITLDEYLDELANIELLFEGL